MLSEQKKSAVFASIIFLLALAFSFALFGKTGAMVVVGLGVMSLPFYLILSKYLNEGEKAVFSLLLGLTLLPSVTFLLGFLMPFSIAIAASLIIFILIGLALWKIKK